MRVVHLAILAGFLSTSQSFNGRGKLLSQISQQRSLSLAEQAASSVPTTLDKVSGMEGTNPVRGPLRSQGSASEVNKTEDMTSLEAAAEGKHAETKKLDQPAEKPNTELLANGNADRVKPSELEQEKHSADSMWGIEDLTRPMCRNCKAIADYEWWLNEYRHQIGAQTVLVMLTALLIWMLGTTAQDFFVPPLIYWSKKLQLRPEIAGATLLALGNGAPDIFAVNMAAHKGDLPLAVSEILGSNMFTLCITGGVVGLGCAMSPNKEGTMNGGRLLDQVSDKRMLVNLGGYFLTIMTLAWIMLDGHSTVWKAILPLIVYGLYLSMLLYCRGDDEGLSSDGCLEAEPDYMANDTSGETGGEQLSTTPLPGLAMPKEEDSVLSKTMWAISLPTYLMRWACIPPVDQQWDPVRRITSSIAPIGMLAFCAIVNVLSIQHTSTTALLGVAILACLASISIYISSGSKPVLPWFYPVIPIFSLLAAMIWMAVLAGEITALVEAIGFTLRVPRLRLGFTAIAWGNSIADLLVCCATLREGHAVMAITAVFAGPLLDDLVAFGSALVWVAADRGIPVMCGPQCPMELKLPLVTSLCFILVAVCLLCALLRDRANRPRLWAGLLFAWYITFLTLILFVEKVDAPQGEVHATPA